MGTELRSIARSAKIAKIAEIEIALKRE